MFRAAELNDADWLRNKYIEEQCSTVEIGKLVGAKPGSVGAALHKHGIPTRNWSDSQTKNFDDGLVLNESVLIGSLLGDGQLRPYNRQSNISVPRFKKKNKFYDHVCFVAKALFTKWEDRIFTVNGKLNGNIFQHFEISSYAHRELVDIYRKWYPASVGYKKVVPDDIVLDSTSLLHWFLDDGYSLRVKGAKYKTVFVVFCSESFSPDHQMFLCETMEKTFGLKTKLLRLKNRGTGYRIKVPTTEVEHFFDLIGPCPAEVPSMAYKWKVK